MGATVLVCFAFSWKNSVGVGFMKGKKPRKSLLFPVTSNVSNKSAAIEAASYCIYLVVIASWFVMIGYCLMVASLRALSSSCCGLDPGKRWRYRGGTIIASLFVWGIRKKRWMKWLRKNSTFSGGRMGVRYYIHTVNHFSLLNAYSLDSFCSLWTFI